MKNRYAILGLILVCFLIVFSGCRREKSIEKIEADVTTKAEQTEDATTTKPTESETDEEETKEVETEDKEPDKEPEKETEKETEEPEKPDTDISSDNVIDIDKESLPYTEEEIYAQLFDINNKVEIFVDISDDTLSQLQADYDEYSSFGSKSPIYRKADMEITITTANDCYTYHIDDIGIRMKGNTSRTSFYSDDEGVYNLVHFKVDFQETFDDEEYYSWDATDWGDDTEGRDARKDRTFATLEKLEFKWNRNDDTTYIREYYTYEFYRASGVLAPHTNLTSFDLGDNHQGVFMMYEPIDKIFIEKYVPEEDQGGDLYKCGWTYSGAGFFADSSIGVENEDKGEFYNYDLKTNKKTSENEALINLLNVVNNKKVTKEQLAEVIDIDNFLLFEAVSYFAGNPDDVRNNYNNYYIYFNASTDKMIFIPYDMDRCFGVICGWDPTGDGMTTVNPFSKYAAGANQNQANPIYVKTVDEGGYYVAEFAAVLDVISKSEWLTTEKFDSIYNIAYNNYKNDVKPDKDYYNTGGYNFAFNNAAPGYNMTFRSYVTAKLATYNKYANSADDYASTVQPFYIRGSFTNWGVNEVYKMTYNEATDTYTYNLTVSSNSPWKVNDGIDGGPGEWFGGMDVCELGVGIHAVADQDDNIILPAGTYKITFYGDTWQIKIEKI